MFYYFLLVWKRALHARVIQPWCCLQEFLIVFALFKSRAILLVVDWQDKAKPLTLQNQLQTKIYFLQQTFLVTILQETYPMKHYRMALLTIGLYKIFAQKLEMQSLISGHSFLTMVLSHLFHANIVLCAVI